MRKCVLIVCCMAFTLGLNARWRFGAKVGGTLSSLNQKIGNVTDNNTNPRFGFLIGGMAEYSFNKEFALQPELLYLLGGSKRSAREEVIIPFLGPVSNVTAESTTTLHYIHLPVNLKYRFRIEGLKFHLAAGPHFTLIAGGKTENAYAYNILGVTATSGNEQNLFASDNRTLKRVDVGAGIGFGVEIGKITIGAGYNFGLTNIANIPNVTTRTVMVNLSAGYFF